MDDRVKSSYRIKVRHLESGEAKAKYLARIRKNEQYYGMTSEEMEKLVSTGDDNWETPEILRWMSAYHVYQSLSLKETPTDGIVGKTTGVSTTGD